MKQLQRRVTGSIALVAAAAGGIAVVAGCTAGPPPARSLSQTEIDSMVERVNRRVDPVPLGTGDGLGRQTYRVYQHARTAEVR
ncbi:MAG: hypothetical protein HKO59_13120 [Phycisphaerales bacterium]|nr:hypothetical protein [Phycisphaerae bacterium]NNF45057.1 hypothetical protein [Phycisphaerales bacterium]NNM26903.1 hypothetical protein [Phycisphaerales bacterium]